MSRAGRIARRGFLIGSAAIAGGVAFGAWRYLTPLPNPLVAQAGQAAINPFVLIRADGVTLITPRADKGQGTLSMQAHLIAEELDVDPATCLIETAPADPVYYNNALVQDMMPVASTDHGWIAERLRDFAGVPAKFLALQMTGGSSSAPDVFDRLRMAGAVARETLKEAAAQVHGVARADLTTEDGAVVLPDGKRLPYGDLAGQAAEIDPVTDVVLRAPSQWKYLGKPVRRTDIVAKSTGTQVFGIDLRMEGMVHASVRRAPLGGAVARMDVSAAEAMPGVLKVVPVTRGVGVIASNSWAAMRAVEAVEIDFTGPDDRAGDQDAIWSTLERAFEGGPDSTRRDDGDVETALGDTPISAEYRVPFLAHAPLEPVNAVVTITDDRCDIWTGTQVPDFVRSHAARIAGLDAAQVHVYSQMIGGSFGHRLELDYIEPAVELARAMPGVPVKTMLSREEDFAQDFPRPAQIARGRGRVSPGKIEVFDLSIASPSVVGSWFGRVFLAPPGPDRTITDGAADQPLAIRNYRVRGFRADETVPVSSWRSVGASGNGFCHGSFLDELFDAAGIDPMDGLIALCDDEPSRLVLQELKALSGWTGRDAGDGRARGVAYCLSFGVPCAEVVEVSQGTAGIVIERAFAVADVGRILDPVNFEAQLSGGMLFGLGHAMNCELTYRNHRPQQRNYHAHQAMRLYQCPEIAVKGLENGPTLRGIGEPGVPPAAAALANAIFALTGQRLRELPLSMGVAFA